MCYPKPGPRCSSHTERDMVKARSRFLVDKSDENRKELNRATRDFMSSPKGLKILSKVAEKETDPTNKEALMLQLEKAKGKRERELNEYKAQTGKNVDGEETSFTSSYDDVDRENFLISSYKSVAEDNYRKAGIDPESPYELGYEPSPSSIEKQSKLDSLKKQISQQGGKHEFKAVYDLNGNILKSRAVKGSQGMSWVVDNPNNPSAKPIFFTPSDDSDDSKARGENAKKGFYVGTVVADAEAGLYTPGGAHSDGVVFTGSPDIQPKDKTMSDCVVVDNGTRTEKEVEEARNKAYPTPTDWELSQAKAQAEDAKEQAEEKRIWEEEEAERKKASEDYAAMMRERKRQRESR